MSRELRDLEAKFWGRRGGARGGTPEREARVRIPNANDKHRVDLPGFHGTPGKIRGNKLRATRTPNLPEPTGVSYGTRAGTARQFGKNLYRTRLRGNVGDAELFMARARQHMRRGLSTGDASAKTQREFQRRGYHGVRWGDREIVMFRGKRVRAHKALLILLEAKG